MPKKINESFDAYQQRLGIFGITFAVVDAIRLLHDTQVSEADSWQHNSSVSVLHVSFSVLMAVIKFLSQCSECGSSVHKLCQAYDHYLSPFGITYAVFASGYSVAACVGDSWTPSFGFVLLQVVGSGAVIPVKQGCIKKYRKDEDNQQAHQHFHLEDIGAAYGITFAIISAIYLLCDIPNNEITASTRIGVCLVMMVARCCFLREPQDDSGRVNFNTDDNGYTAHEIDPNVDPFYQDKIILY